jgi:hypothetical protein
MCACVCVCVCVCAFACVSEIKRKSVCVYEFVRYTYRLVAVCPP